MKHILLLCALFAFASLLEAVEVSIGTTRLTIPSPEGYSPVTRAMQPYEELSKQFVPRTHEQLAQFLTTAEAESAARGEMPQAQRRFYVQTIRKLSHREVAAAEFSRLKGLIKSQNDAKSEKVQARLAAGSAEQGGDRLPDRQLALDQIIPLSPHQETDRTLAYSMIVKFTGRDAQGRPAVLEGVATSTLLHLQGTVLLLYVNAEKSALKWSRTESEKWVDAVLAANPLLSGIATREPNPAPTRIDWTRVLAYSVGGAALGGLIGGLTYLLRQRTG